MEEESNNKKKEKSKLQIFYTYIYRLFFIEVVAK